MTRPSTTVQYSMVNGGWTVICRTCRAWFGPYQAEDYAQQVADFDHGHTTASGPDEPAYHLGFGLAVTVENGPEEQVR